MFSPDRRLVCAGGLLAVPPGLFLCALLCWPDLGTDALEAPGLRSACPQERGRLEQLDRGLAATRRSREAKGDVARELAEGRLTLLEAAARCRAIDRRKPDFYWDGFRRGMPHASDEERHCREVIAAVRATIPLGREASDQLALRLEAE